MQERKMGGATLSSKGSSSISEKTRIEYGNHLESEIRIRVHILLFGDGLSPLNDLF
jgi:hypothetical protein